MTPDTVLSLLWAVRLRLGSFGVMPPEPGDLLLESEHRAAMARDARIAAGLENGCDADIRDSPLRPRSVLDRLEPPSLDPVVFGEGPT